jgi:hypothetical protein
VPISSHAERGLVPRPRIKPLRPGISSAAAETYSALANPELYLLLTRLHGWSASRYQRWLADSLQRLLFADVPTR